MTKQLRRRMYDKPLVVHQMVDVPARLYEYRIRQIWRQGGNIVDRLRVPIRQYVAPGSRSRLRQTLFVKNASYAIFRRLIDMKKRSERGGFVRIKPSCLIR